MKKIAIISTHPIQYYAPFFQLLAKEKNLHIHVFYTAGQAASSGKFDIDFGKHISWDIDLLSGYNHSFLKNTANKPGSHHFKGIINPVAIQEITAFNPDFLLIYGWAYQSHLKIMRHFHKRVEIWFRGDSTVLDVQTGIKRFFRKLFLKWVYQHADKFLYVGQANKDYFLSIGVNERHLFFVPHAVDNDRFSIETSGLDLFKQKLNVNKNDKIILFAGKLEEKKDPVLLLEAFIRLDRNDWSLLFVGDGILSENLKTRAKGSRLSRKIYFIDFQNQSVMPKVYQLCDIFCLPSKGPGETWGLAVNEAMAAGKAVLVSDKVGCFKDLVRVGKNGYIFQHGSIDSISKNLTLLLDGDLEDFGRQSKKIINNYSFVNQVRAVLKLVSHN